MTESKPGFIATVKSFPATFWVANTMEIFERMAWYGFYALSSLYITGPVETGGLGFTSEARGQLQAIVPFFLYLFPVATGALADRYGYKKMFILAYLGMVLFYYALGQFKTFPMFLGAFMMVAISAAIFKPVVVGTVARVTDERNSSMGFGIFYMMVNIGGFIGPMVAGVVRGISWKYVFIACSIWAAINLLIVLVFYKDPSTEASSASRRTLGKVASDAVEVLGNIRFGATVFTVLIALMLANQGFAWFSWSRCVTFIIAWLVLNFVWDAFLRAMGCGEYEAVSGRRRYLTAPMRVSNWRFAVFLLIMSGFWTSFNQIFITMPEYIRDYTETKPMVDAGNRLFNRLGKPEWIDGLAAIEATELLESFDGLVRRTRGVAPMLAADAASDEEENADARKARIERLPSDPGLGDDASKRLAELASRLNSAGVAHPVEAIDLADAARAALNYKVRITPVELGDLIGQVPTKFESVSDADLATALATINGRLAARGRPPFEGPQADQLQQALEKLMVEHGPLVSADALNATSASLPNAGGTLEPKVLAFGVRDLAYRPTIWDRMEAGRQVNPEHIVNFDALAIVILQVFISFLMGKFHRFTTMIVGMVIAAIGIGLSFMAGGTMIGPLGGSLLVVVAGIVIFAVGEMMASPTSQEYVGRIAPRDKVATYMGYYFVAIALGNLFGGILSGQLYGKLARDMQRPDLMWGAFGAIMLFTAFVFLLYDRFAVPREPAKAAA